MPTVLTNEQFDVAFSECERNRMYPQYYRKETDMQKVKMKHISSVTRAQNLLETSVDVGKNLKLRRSIERDISLLSEVRSILFYMFENPALPFDIAQPDSAQPILDQIAD